VEYDLFGMSNAKDIRRRRRWDVKAHARWQKKVSGRKLARSEAALSQSREDRLLIEREANAQLKRLIK
jgi:hypothetical protein